MRVTRRTFLRTTGAAIPTIFVARNGLAYRQADVPPPGPAAAALARKLPRWRGFNLLEKFNVGRHGPFVEEDFAWMSEWGFDFVRLPMDYRCWTDPADPYRLKEEVLKHIDQAVEWGQKYKIHVSLNLHRAPGYTVAQPPEKLNLWRDEEAQRQFDFQWTTFAKRYQGIPPQQLSFNLVNEPANISPSDYAKVVRRVVTAIRKVDPERLIISDGLQWGRDPVFEIADLGVAQSTRGYDPMPVSHYMASWVGGERWPRPTWPLKEGNRVYDRNYLAEDRIRPWKELEKRGVGVHVGEFGAFNKTPHDVVLAWLGDYLSLWKEAGWGWAMWNFRGSFGILDSGREDVVYEDFRGHKLDRKLLELLLRS
ncbi:MAG: cellulase family glycosylhydrolase [Thermoguttaceae bacterium]|nr:cellulase family glycosylhydrolase [Thermoguttaceae bacterium]MDW8077382.1 cellulase family glycosylhydrolase [Thermoguttaceae bacterium]